MLREAPRSTAMCVRNSLAYALKSPDTDRTTSSRAEPPDLDMGHTLAIGHVPDPAPAARFAHGGRSVPGMARAALTT
ncbi:MAG: hypothetical protein Kow0056_00790 [Coriobacteriia bacterium]